jgi:uncharacterized membrane protein
VNATWKADAVALGMIAAMFVLAAVMWSVAPDQIPVHWNWAGQPDRFGGRFEGLLGLPLAAAGIYALLLFLPRHRRACCRRRRKRRLLVFRVEE